MNEKYLENLECTECGKRIKREKFKINHICKDYVERDTSNLKIVCSKCDGNTGERNE